MANKNTKALILTILLASLIAGTLDGLAAVFILAKGQAAMAFKYIASAVYGKQAFAGGSEMIWAGVAFHYLIAAIFTTLFFILYDLIPVIRKRAVLVAIIYGIFVWVVMNLLVLPLTQVTNTITLTGAIKNMLILIVCIALPIVLMRYRYGQVQSSV
ncbi:hypothetical protein [Mucilaginibacter aquariorum]|uniref:DUF1440 domain-containing protein n=1 Tax=Mucilaginibacter aquariorum TaxID=2967225 RepID=A0ABT1SZ29_9SPHI|nr:hypothetical protein [Mucilaginibacter aquariorum]MCQ6957584.1 hypothetical protein [Mucilaginibacter aquariorum]